MSSLRATTASDGRRSVRLIGSLRKKRKDGQSPNQTLPETRQVRAILHRLQARTVSFWMNNSLALLRNGILLLLTTRTYLLRRMLRIYRLSFPHAHKTVLLAG